MSSASTILDPSGDQSQTELSRLSRLYDFPEYVKEALDLNAEEVMTCPAENPALCADPRFKKYACHTQAATWLSACYYFDKQAEYHPNERKHIEHRLDHFADFFRIRGDYESVKQAAEKKASAELPDSSYAYVWADEQTGEKTRHLPMRSAMEVKAASDWLLKYRDQLPFSDRHVIATRILEKASRFGAGLGDDADEFLERQAGLGVPDIPEIVTQLRYRQRLCKEAAFGVALNSLADAVEQMPEQACSPDRLVELTRTIDSIDSHMKLAHVYDGTLLKRPEDFVFGVVRSKVAAARDAVCAFTNGTVYEKQQFARLSRQDVTEAMGDDFANEVCSGFSVDPEKMAAIADTLPRPDADALDSLLNDVGIRPTLQKAASSPFPPEIQKAFADLYRQPAS